MAEYIDKEIAYARLSIFGMNVQKMVIELPTANVKEIVYAHWIEDDDGVFICSNCGNAESSDGRYCSYCGAEMREVIE